MTIKVAGRVFYAAKSFNPKRPQADIETDEGEWADSLSGDGDEIWKRLDFSNDVLFKLPKSQSFDIDFTDVINAANADPWVAQKVPNDVWSAQVRMSVSNYDADRDLIRLSFVNTNEEPEKTDKFERTLFDCTLTVELHGIAASHFTDNYLYEGLKERGDDDPFEQRYHYDFRTINCQAEWIDKGKKFSTTHYGYYEQSNVRPRRSYKNIDTTFNNLCTEDGLKRTLTALIYEMRSKSVLYHSKLPENLEGWQPREGSKESTWSERARLVEQFDKLLQRVELASELLLSNEKAQKAFLCMNMAFDNYYRTREDQDLSKASKAPGWRLFQLVFILVSLDSVIREKDLDVVDVLHVDTGGGKSEAYYGLMICTSLYERATGKEDGVTAIVKFPLRMLSIQQLQRIAGVMMHAEVVRRSHQDEFPGSPFSLGYYVGTSDEFPNLYMRVRNTLLDEGGNPLAQAPESLIVPQCPLCPPGSKGVLRLIDNPAAMRVDHQCDRCNETFTICLSDREIYRWRPTVIVSTVDKWASISSQRRLRNILGGNGSMCEHGHGFIPSGDECENNRDEFYKCDIIGENEKNVSGPLLSIQDEMHLLSEGFGTIASHFEGAIETMIKETSGRGLKHIAMSATLNGSAMQIEQLYRKKTFVVPGSCPDGPGTIDDLFFEKVEGPKRIIYGLKPNMRDNHFASLVTLLYFFEFVAEAQKSYLSDPASFCARYELDNPLEAEKLLRMYLVPLTYHLKKQDAHDMERLQDQLITESLEATAPVHLNGVVASGDSRLEELKRLINQVQEYVKQYDFTKMNGEPQDLLSIYATSVVSHGVDLSELNFMVFQGLPYSASEYIQALSRVGRANLGIVILWFYPNRVRDDSYYRNFRRYHDTLDHQVKPVPINRYSKLGLYQTINSLFCASILNYLSNKDDKPLYQVKDIKKLSQKQKQDIIRFISESYGRPNTLSMDVPAEVEARLDQVVKSGAKDNAFLVSVLADSGDFYYRNQTGMRGIQEEMVVILSSKDRSVVERMVGER
jgi:hypothetical protein